MTSMSIDESLIDRLMKRMANRDTHEGHSTLVHDVYWQKRIGKKDGCFFIVNCYFFLVAYCICLAIILSQYSPRKGTRTFCFRVAGRWNI